MVYLCTAGSTLPGVFPLECKQNVYKLYPKKDYLIIKEIFRCHVVLYYDVIPDIFSWFCVLLDSKFIESF